VVSTSSPLWASVYNFKQPIYSWERKSPAPVGEEVRLVLVCVCVCGYSN